MNNVVPLIVSVLSFAAPAVAQTPVMLRDVYPGPNGSLPRDFTDTPSLTVFAARDDRTGTELYKTDGTTAGTVLVKDIRRGSRGSEPREFAPLPDGRVLFRASGVLGDEPWVTDGTAAGTVQLADIRPGLGGSHPSGFTWHPIHQVYVFAADDGVRGRELWQTDGTAAGTKLLQNIHPDTSGPTGSDPDSFVLRDDGSLFFVATDDKRGTEVWVFDEIGAARIVADVSPGVGSSFPTRLTLAGGKLFFYALDASRRIGQELWCSDGTPAGTSLVKDINPGFRGSFSATPTRFVEFGGQLYFTATTSVHGNELWRSNGTAAGTVMVADVWPGSRSSSIRDLTVVGNQLYFTAIDARLDLELYVLQAGAAAPARIDVEPGRTSSSPQHLFAVGDALYFSARVSSAGPSPALWRATGPNALSLVALSPVSPQRFAATRHGLMFDGFATATGQEPYAQGYQEAHVICVGVACGRVRPTLEVSRPVLGTQLRVSGIAKNAVGGAVGFSLPSRAATPLAGGCSFHGDLATALFRPVSPDPVTGRWSFSLPLPGDPRLAGQILSAQGVFVSVISRVVYSTTGVKLLVLGR